jgi:hypothetical protein
MTTVRRPPTEGQSTDPPADRLLHRPLSVAQRRSLRALLHDLRRKFGTWNLLAEAMGVSRWTLRDVARGREAGSPWLATRAAALAELPVEQILAGGILPAGICPTCGAPLAKRGAPSSAQKRGAR